MYINIFWFRPSLSNTHVYMCTHVNAARNHFSDQRFLIAAVPKGLLLMQWYQPQHAFKHVMVKVMIVCVCVCVCGRGGG